MSSGIRRPSKKPGTSAAGMRPGARRPAAPAPAARGQPAAAEVDTRASTDYTLMAATRVRTHNVMRFQTPKPVDLTAFAPPVKMRRRNREYFRLKNKQRNEERQRQQEQEQEPAGAAESERPKADMSLIADVGGARRNKRNLFKKRTKQVYFADEQKRRLDIEEARPWVLEDADEREVWTGELEGGQTSAYVLFVLAEDGFRVVPVDRWYKFAPKLKYRTMTLDEAEEELNRMQKAHASRDLWIMHRRNQQDAEPGAAAPAAGAAAPALVEAEADVFASDDDLDSGDERRPKARAKADKHGGLDEVEFEMEFDDDEELGDVQFEFNQEAEDDKQRTKAYESIFASDDEDYGDDGAEGRPPEERKDVRALRKLMRKREENNDYASDREENPYLSEEDEDSDESDAAEPKPEPAAEARPEAKPEVKPEARPAPLAGSAAAAAAKKRKRVSAPAPHHAHHARAGSSPAPAPASERAKHFKPGATLITKHEIVELIRGGVSTTKELIGHLRKKLKANPDNKQRIHAILKEVATFKNNQLALKKHLGD
ncbi:transcription factor IIF subunit tfg1 [Coemansia sp. RSA 2708]|nr:transcription factor IIF subunit tfg1 [Coemansia sp. RSA 2708]